MIICLLHQFKPLPFAHRRATSRMNSLARKAPRLALAFAFVLSGYALRAQAPTTAATNSAAPKTPAAASTTAPASAAPKKASAKSAPPAPPKPGPHADMAFPSPATTARAQTRAAPTTGERIVFIGNGLAERDVYYSRLETELHLRYPDRQLIIRNLGRPGDMSTLANASRS